ncbi:hypothetical protein [Spirillospora sp. NPDC047279]|uniref:hypothetical protein n=1 Tax=Spirillospora sp. NPDC047279 TaxID=3155478 RepID=UPI0033CA31D0
MTRGPGRGGATRGKNIPGAGKLVKLVNGTGGFPGQGPWQPDKYKGLPQRKGKNPPLPNAMRGQIGNDLSEAAAKKRGESVIAKEVRFHEPGDWKDVTKADHVVKMPDGKINGVEIKSGGGELTDQQKKFYPRIPDGNVEVGSSSLKDEGLPKRHVLTPGEIPEVRVERWDVDSMPTSTKNALEHHTVQDVLDGKAGPAEQQALDNWMGQSGSRVVETTYRQTPPAAPTP